MFALLALVCAADVPQFEVVNKCPLVVVNKMPVATVAVPTKVSEPGYHVHRCANGHEWSHTDASRGNVAEHTCPVCGKQDWQPKQTGVRIVNAAAPAVSYYTPVVGNSTCPGGNCPQQAGRWVR